MLQSHNLFIAWRRQPYWWRIVVHKASSGVLGVSKSKPLKAEKTLSSSQVPVKSPSHRLFPPGWECAKKLVSKFIFSEGREDKFLSEKL